MWTWLHLKLNFKCILKNTDIYLTLLRRKRSTNLLILWGSQELGAGQSMGVSELAGRREESSPGAQHLGIISLDPQGEGQQDVMLQAFPWRNWPFSSNLIFPQVQPCIRDMQDNGDIILLLSVQQKWIWKVPFEMVWCRLPWKLPSSCLSYYFIAICSSLHTSLRPV